MITNRTAGPTERSDRAKLTVESPLMPRRAILTQEVLAGIPALVEQGFCRVEIAERLGCKASTLQVQCSNAGISLRVRKRLELRVGVPLSFREDR